MAELRPSTAAAIILGVFLVTAILGALAVIESPETGKEFIGIVRDQVLGKVDPKDPLLFLVIFLNNLQACILLFLGGATLGILTLFIIGTNGIIIGGIMELVREEKGLLYVAAAILPHGVFEIPSFVLAGALGLLLGSSVLAEWRGGGDSAAAAAVHLRTFLLVVVPLVAIAACIEAFITPQVIHLVA